MKLLNTTLLCTSASYTSLRTELERRFLQIWHFRPSRWSSWSIWRRNWGKCRSRTSHRSLETREGSSSSSHHSGSTLPLDKRNNKIYFSISLFCVLCYTYVLWSMFDVLNSLCCVFFSCLCCVLRVLCVVLYMLCVLCYIANRRYTECYSRIMWEMSITSHCWYDTYFIIEMLPVWCVLPWKLPGSAPILVSFLHVVIDVGGWCCVDCRSSKKVNKATTKPKKPTPMENINNEISIIKTQLEVITSCLTKACSLPCVNNEQTIVQSTKPVVFKCSQSIPTTSSAALAPSQIQKLDSKLCTEVLSAMHTELQSKEQRSKNLFVTGTSG